MIKSQQYVIRHQQEMLAIQKKVLKKQSELCLELVQEIERVRAAVQSMTSHEMQHVLSMLNAVRREKDNHDILISASQILQTVSDESLMSQIMSLESEEEQKAVFVELMVSFHKTYFDYIIYYQRAKYISNTFRQASVTFSKS